MHPNRGKIQAQGCQQVSKVTVALLRPTGFNIRLMTNSRTRVLTDAVQIPDHVYTMTEGIFQIGADGVDVEAIVRDIQESVEEKIRAGEFPDPTIAQAERHNLAYLQNQDTFMDYYMACLREAVYVDINDYEIRERRRFGSGLLVHLKRSIWSMLKFYTYRLWSQQNQANGLMVAAIDGMDQKSSRKIEALEARVAALEAKFGNRDS